MWRFLLLALILQKLTLAPSAAIPSQSQDSKKCCPCPSTLRSEPGDPVELPELEDSDDGIPPEEPNMVVPKSSGQSRVRSRPGCTCREGDMDSSGSTPLRSISRPDKLLGSPPPYPKSIFHPEVGLANSLLKTFQAANEEELREARLRASSRPNTLGSARRTATITINNPSPGSQNSFLETSKNSPSLGISNSLLESLRNPKTFPESTRPSLENTKSVLGSRLRNKPSIRPNSLLRSSLLNPSRLSGLEKPLTSQRSGLLGLGNLRAADSDTASSSTSSLQTAPSRLGIALRAPSGLGSVSSAFTKPQLGDANSAILQSRLGSANTPTTQTGLGSVNSGISRLGSPRSTISQTRSSSTNYATSQPSRLGSSNAIISQPILGSANSGISHPSRLRSDMSNVAIPKPRLGSANAAITQYRLGNSLLKPAIKKVPLLGNPLGSSKIESALKGHNLGLSSSLPSTLRRRLLSRLGSLGSRNAQIGLANQAPAMFGAALSKPTATTIAKAGLLGTAPDLRSNIDGMARSASDVVGQRVPFLGSKLGSPLTYMNADKLGSNLPNNGLLRDSLVLIDGKPVDPLRMIFKMKRKLLDLLVGNPNVKEENDPMDDESTNVSNVVIVPSSENLKSEMASSNDSVDDLAVKPGLKSTLKQKISPLSQNIKEASNPNTQFFNPKLSSPRSPKKSKPEVLRSELIGQPDDLMDDTTDNSQTSNVPKIPKLSVSTQKLEADTPIIPVEPNTRGNINTVINETPKPEKLNSNLIVETEDIMNDSTEKPASQFSTNNGSPLSSVKLQAAKLPSLRERLQKLLNPVASNSVAAEATEPEVLRSINVQPDEPKQPAATPMIPKMSPSSQTLLKDTLSKSGKTELLPEFEPKRMKTELTDVRTQNGQSPLLKLLTSKDQNTPQLGNANSHTPRISSINPAISQPARLGSVSPAISKPSRPSIRNSAISQPSRLASADSIISQPASLGSGISGNSQTRLASTNPSNTSKFPKSISNLIASSNNKSGTNGECEAHLENRAKTEIEEPNSALDKGEATNVVPATLRAFDDCERCSTKDTEVVAKELNPVKVYDCKLVCNK